MTGAQARRWGIAAAPPLAWTLHLLGVYLLEEVVCKTGLKGGQVLGVSVFFALALAVTGGASAVAMAAALAGYRHRDDAEDQSPVGTGRRRFLARAGAVLGVLFLAAILMQSLPLLFFDSCA